MVVFNKDTEQVDRSGFVDTNQTRDEMMWRNNSAMEKKTGEKFKARKTRNGFSNESDSWFVSGQKVKKK